MDERKLRWEAVELCDFISAADSLGVFGVTVALLCSHEDDITESTAEEDIGDAAVLSRRRSCTSAVALRRGLASRDDEAPLGAAAFDQRLLF